MQAIILAAGMGKRLKELTRNNTKCMVRVNGMTLIERMLKQLDALGLDRIVLVVGYEKQKLMDYIGTLEIATPVSFISNDVYYKTNNIYSLALAKELLKEDDTLLLESDLIFEDSVLECIVEDPRETLALVDKYESWMDGTVVELDEEDNILSFIGGKKISFSRTPLYYKTVNIYKFSREFSRHQYVPFLEAYCEALGDNEYYEQVLRVITTLDNAEIRAKRLQGQIWYEIDDIQDLDIAESMFAPTSDEKLSLIQGRYGGYWRYPQMLDFCYLVNPYFPPQRMLDEMKASFDKLLTQYPSGMRVNSLLAAKNFGVSQKNIVIGNGAAELIKELMSLLTGRFGVAKPTFEEYPNRRSEEEIVPFRAENRDFSYTEEDLMAYYECHPVQNLLLINPDNPSGNYISRAGLEKLLEWSRGKKINLIVDESFADFAEEEDNSLIVQKTLDENPQLYVVKSISKSYGVPGLRLGILASGNTDVVSKIKKSVSIWNINSFAEFYMQIAEKYNADYRTALAQFREERSRFVNRLKEIPGVRVIPSQANFFMIELEEGWTARELARRLLTRHNIFVKDLSSKISDGQYLRIAIRNAADNDKLIAALHTFQGCFVKNKFILKDT